METKRRTGRKKKSDRVPATFEPGFLANLDQRTGIAQMMGDRYRELTDDLGGADQLSYSQKLLAEKVLWIQHYMAIQETMLATGYVADFDAGKYSVMVNSLQGLLAKLGLKRIAKQAPGISELIQRGQQ